MVEQKLDAEAKSVIRRAISCANGWDESTRKAGRKRGWKSL